jgi:hypothetical protein
MARGIFGTGAGFDAPAAGKAGGRPVGRDLSKHAQRDLALRAAQQRAHRQAIMPGGAIKLGECPTPSSLGNAGGTAWASARRSLWAT